MLNRKSLLLLLPVILVSCTLLGCGSGADTARVTGVVTLDGVPVEGAGVVFMPDAGGRPANATTDASGRFTVDAPVGPNVVSVTKTRRLGGAPAGEGAEQETAADMGEQAELEYLVPMKYGTPTTSDLKVDVATGMQPVTLELT